MRTVPLGEVVKIVSGATPKTAVVEYWSGDVPWVTPADLSKLEGAYISETPRMLTEVGVRSCATTILPVGSVLLSSRAPIGHVALNEVPMATNQGFKSLVTGPALDAKYLYHWIKANKDYLQSLGNGATFKELSKRTVEQIRVPLPSVADQRRMAAILDHADVLRAKRRRVLAHLDALTQAIFHDMFGDPASNPHAFPLETLGGLSLKFGDGPFGSNLKSEHYRSQGVPVIRLQNIGVGKFLGTDRTFVSEAHYEALKKHDCQPGDVLIATMGDPNLRACIQPATIPLALNKADCVQMRVDPDRASAEWACALLNMPGTLALANSLILGQTRSRISMGRLRGLEVPVPPFAMQKRFAERVQALRRAQGQLEVSIERTDSLFASLQSRAFKGEL